MNRTIYLIGSALDRLQEIPERSIHCIVTSPPYWGLRAYKGDKGMIGLEPSFPEHLENLMMVFDGCKRVLRDDGTFWLNYGDAYVHKRGDGLKPREDKEVGRAQWALEHRHETNHLGMGDLQPKNLMMMPARIALALQDRGWILRSKIIWAKKNCMPESAKDRPTSSYEEIFLFSKQKRYFYDHISVRTKMKDISLNKLNQPTFDQQQGGPKDSKSGNRSHRKTLENLKKRKQDALGKSNYTGFNDRYKKSRECRGNDGLHRNGLYGSTLGDSFNNANLRNVWHLSTESFKGAHFATFPTKLVEPCIKAGTSEKGVCSKCGSPWIRESKKSFVNKGGGHKSTFGPEDSLAKSKSIKKGKSSNPTDYTKYETLAWKPSCECEDADVIPATVLDPFAGAGTTGMVANYLQRDSILVEISPEYAKLGADRIQNDGGMLTTVEIRK